MTSQYLPLTSLAVGEAGTIDHILLPPADREFLIRFGLAAGAEIRFCRRAPFGDPNVYSIEGTHFAVRSEVADHIFVLRPVSPPEST
jgi:Fe2+ transport system protein FeoA